MPVSTGIIVPNLPEFDALIADDARQVLYGSDLKNGRLYIVSMRDGSTIGRIMLGADKASRPLGMDISPDGARLAVGLSAAAQIAIVDLNTRAIVQRVDSLGRNRNAAFDVRYGRAGRLYSVGDGFLHIFDTTSGAQMGTTNRAIAVKNPRLAITADKRWLYMMDRSGDSTKLVRWDVSTDSPAAIDASETDAPSNLPVGVQAVVKPDGSAILTSAGQVLSPSLDRQLGAFQSYGTRARTVALVPATDHLFIGAGCDCRSILEDGASAPWKSYGERPLHGIATAIALNVSATMLYVSSSLPSSASSSHASTSQLEIFNLTIPAG